jgi:penicillin-binding protein 2
MNESRKYIIQGVIVLSSIVFVFKLFSIQVLDGNYKLAAENNIVQKIVEYPYRGLILDREGEPIVINTPIYDLMIVPREVQMTDSLAFCNLMNITIEDFKVKIKAAAKYSTIKPSIFIDKLSNQEFARIQDKIINYQGFYVLARTVRSYPDRMLSNALGYVGEISKRQLERDSTGYYSQGDFIGISGMESQYEKVLRGKRGVSYKMVNVRGVEKGNFKDGQYDTLSIPGENIISTIDRDLQKYAEKLLEGKVGSAVAIEPSTGEILAFVSSPSYDPNLLSGKNFSAAYNQLTLDTLKPLFNRPLMAMYPPGSMFKTVQALIAMQYKVLTPNEIIYSDGNLIGDLAPNGPYNLIRAITLSSNNYFYKVFRRIINQDVDPNTYIDSRIGLERWKASLAKFGLGIVLPTDLPNVKSGLIPNADYYDRIYGKNRWKFSNIYSLSIGQGEVLVTPLQMANLGAIIANKGYFYYPHIVKGINTTGNKPEIFRQRNFAGVDTSHYQVVIDGMEAVVSSGSARRAFIPDIVVCGKTSTVQNPQGPDHSGFMGYAPKVNPQIAIAVYVENTGWGGRAAASIASLLIEYQVSGEIKRQWLEDYVLKGEFLY